MVIKFEDFQKVDMRSGTILRVERLASPKYTTHKLIVDFGKEVGEKVSGARVVKYDEKDLIGKQMIGVINLEPRRIGSLTSEVLLLGVPDDEKECVLLGPDEPIENGRKVY